MLSCIAGLDRQLRGAPDEALTLGLLAVAGVCVAVALFTSPVIKATVFAWAVLP